MPLKLDDWLAANGGLTHLKLKMDNATADEIAGEVKKQTGVEIVPDQQLRGAEQNVQRFSVEATGQPFWEAIRDWNKSDKPNAPTLSLQRDWSHPGGWRMVTWNSGPPGRWLQAGPCLFGANSLSVSHTRSRSLDPKDDPKVNPKAAPSSESNTLSMQCSMLIDPRLRPLILGLITQIDSASDNLGRPLAQRENYQQIWLDDNNDYSNFNLEAPAPDATRLRSLKGTLRLGVITKHEKWEVDLKANPKATRSFKSQESEFTLRLDGVEPRLSSWGLRLHLERKDIGPKRVFKAKSERNMGGQEARLGPYQDVMRSVRLLNAEGQPLSLNGSSSRENEDNGVHTIDIEMTVSQNDDKDLEHSTPAKLVVDVPLEWREVDVPFEFQDLPLP